MKFELYLPLTTLTVLTFTRDGTNLKIRRTDSTLDEI